MREPEFQYKRIPVTVVPGMDKEKFEDEVLSELAVINDVEIPQQMVENEVNGMVLELKYQMNYDALMHGNYHPFQQDEIERKMDEIREEAHNRIKIRMLIKKVIEAENMTVTRQELMDEAELIAERQQINVESVRDLLGSDMDLLKDDLLTRKAVRFVCDHAAITKITSEAMSDGLINEYEKCC